MTTIPEVPQAPSDPLDTAAREEFFARAQAYVEAVNTAVQEGLEENGFSHAMGQNLAQRMGISLPEAPKSEPVNSPHLRMVKAATKKKARKRVRTAI